MEKLSQLKKNYFLYLDGKARHLAHLFIKRKHGTPLLLDYIGELYDSAKSDSAFKSNKFEVAYHNPISSELEFLIARVFFHYSNLKGFGWKIYLRRQFGKTAPDIRIEKGDKTIAIIEIKAKAGWIQPFFNSDRMGEDLSRWRSGKSDFNPKELIKRVQNQFQKYNKEYGIRPERVFILLPTLIHTHRKGSRRRMVDYESDFSKNSRLPKTNLILLSNNLSLDLSKNSDGSKYEPTKKLEHLFEILGKMK